MCKEVQRQDLSSLVPMAGSMHPLGLLHEPHYVRTCHDCLYQCVMVFWIVCCPLAVPSGPPEELMILTSGPSTLTVLWSAPATYREVVTGYIIRCAPQNDGSNYMELSRISTRFSAPFHNLIPNTTYNCEVYTTSAFGNSTPATGSASTPPRES